jgi:hypothetical protein
LLQPGCTSVPTGLSRLVSADGVVRYVALEGGFYSLESDNGDRFDPTNLPADFKQDGLPVRFTGRVRTDMMSIHAYGEILTLTAITTR